MSIVPKDGQAKAADAFSDMIAAPNAPAPAATYRRHLEHVRDATIESMTDTEQ